MLIDSPRLTAADHQHWARMEHYDDVLSRDPRLDRLADQGRHAIREWAAAGPGVASVSWGKDSVVMAHLAATSGVDVPLVWVRGEPWETPECQQVRDHFLAAHPHVRYEERPVTYLNPRRGEPGDDATDRPPPSWVFEQVVPERYITGLRGQESRMRAMSIAHRGMVTARTCRPIARWTAEQVFSWLHREDLAVHPVYAMTSGGHYDRRWLRVHTLGGRGPDRSAVHGWDMTGWEDTYYGDVITAAIASRTHMWVS